MVSACEENALKQLSYVCQLALMPSEVELLMSCNRATCIYLYYAIISTSSSITEYGHHRYRAYSIHISEYITMCLRITMTAKKCPYNNFISLVKERGSDPLCWALIFWGFDQEVHTGDRGCSEAPAQRDGVDAGLFQGDYLLCLPL